MVARMSIPSMGTLKLSEPGELGREAGARGVWERVRAAPGRRWQVSSGIGAGGAVTGKGGGAESREASRKREAV